VRSMEGTLQNRIEESRQIERQICLGTDKIVSCRKFRRVCEALWPLKTAAHIASIAGKDERTAARWLAGEFKPPNCVLIAILAEIDSED